MNLVDFTKPVILTHKKPNFSYLEELITVDEGYNDEGPLIINLSSRKSMEVSFVAHGLLESSLEPLSLILLLRSGRT